jgi:ribonuclease P protein component
MRDPVRMGIVSEDASHDSLRVSTRKSADFPRRVRLLRHADFELVYKQGKRHFATHMTIFYRQRESDAGMRVGFTVGRALGGSVERNRLKRRLREAVRLQFPANPAAVDVVVNPKKSLLKAEFSDITKEIARAFAVIQKAVLQKAAGRAGS